MIELITASLSRQPLAVVTAPDNLHDFIIETLATHVIQHLSLAVKLIECIDDESILLSDRSVFFNFFLIESHKIVSSENELLLKASLDFDEVSQAHEFIIFIHGLLEPFLKDNFTRYSTVFLNHVISEVKTRLANLGVNQNG